MVKDTDATGGTRRSSRVSGQQRTAGRRTTRAKAGPEPPTRSFQQPKKKQQNKKATSVSTRPPRVPRGAKGGRPTSQDEENAAEFLATLPKAQFPASRQQTQEGLAPSAVGAAASAGKRSSPGRLQEYGGSNAAMASNSAERASRPVENAGVSGSGVDEGGSTEPLAAALNKEAARRSSGVGGTSSHDSRVGTSACGTRARKRAGSTTGTSVGAGSNKAKSAGRTGARKGSGKTSQPSGATRAPASEQETPESGTKRPGSSAGAEAAEPSSEEDAQQPPKKSKKKRKKSNFDLQFEVRLDF